MRYAASSSVVPSKAHALCRSVLCGESQGITNPLSISCMNKMTLDISCIHKIAKVILHVV